MLGLSVDQINQGIVNQLMNLVLMERLFVRNILFQSFILPTRGITPSTVGKSICTDVKCARFRTCIEEDLLLPTVQCVSKCYDDYCENSAICEHSNANFAPRCFCQDDERVWFFGERCQYRLEDWLLYIILAVLTLLVLISICILLCMMIRRCRKNRRKSEGTYIARSEDFNTEIPDSSLASDPHFTQYNRKYSGSMNNTHEVSVFLKL